MIDRNQVHEGMVVRGSNGEKVGRVLSCMEGSFVVEKGFLLVTDYAARYDDVAAISGDTIQLSRPREELAHSERAPSRGGGPGESITFGMSGDVATSQPSRGVVWPSYGDEGGGGLL